MANDPVVKFRGDLVDFFKNKLTKDGLLKEEEKRGRKGQRVILPPRYKCTTLDSVDKIASNLKVLIDFSREQIDVQN